MPYRPLLTAHPGRVTRYVGLDLPDNEYQPPDVAWNGRTMPFADGAFDSAMATEIFEHVRSRSRSCARSTGCCARAAPCSSPLRSCGRSTPSRTTSTATHLLPWNDTSAMPASPTSGCAQWKLGRDLGQMLGLWARRRPMRRSWRRVLSVMLTPLVAALAARDELPSDFMTCPMLTGLAGLARKPGSSATPSPFSRRGSGNGRRRHPTPRDRASARAHGAGGGRGGARRRMDVEGPLLALDRDGYPGPVRRVARAWDGASACAWKNPATSRSAGS